LRENEVIGADIFFHDDGNIYEHDGSQSVFTTYDANTWTHMRLDFECGSGGYEGLSADTFYVYVNGVKFGPFDFMNPVLGIDQIWFDSGDDYSTRYIDAIGYSWDPNYNIGDNRRDGLLISFENSTAMDWVGYSIDNQANKTILGNTSISMPDPGLHKIQVFGNDSLGTMYGSSIRYFSVSPLNLISPENKTYFQPMSGYYPATNGFENVQLGKLSSNMDDNPSDPNCGASVISNKNQHKKVVHIDDDSSTGRVRLNYNFTDRDYGTMEFWVLTEDASNPLVMSFLDGTSIRFRIELKNDKWYQYVGSTDILIPNFDGIYDPQDNMWYHLMFHFRGTGAPSYQSLNENQYRLLIDGLDSGPLNFQIPGASAERIRFFTANAPTSDFWVDAFGESWDFQHNVGDNRYEGLLISLENNTNVDWMGYSLDGQNNITILGNTTIPMPDPGLHNLILTVNDTVGTFFKSELRYFSVLLSGPTISAVTPSLNQYYGVSAPSFNINAQGANLDKFWYSLDGGITNISFYSSSGVISQSEWDKYAHGPVQIRFYVNNSFNQIDYDVVTVNKDLNAPTTSIYFVPYSGANVVLPATLFSLVATDNSESGVSTIQYRIDSSAWIPYSGAFTLSSYASGFYTITYQSIDAVGNVETEKYLVIELYIPSPPPDPPNFIPFLLIGIGVGLVALIGIGIFLYSRRRTPKTPIKARTEEKPSPGSDKLKVCPFCFAQIKINSKFCISCGASLEKE
jgi:hypothetical protein